MTKRSVRAVLIFGGVLVFTGSGRASGQQAGSAAANEPAPVINAFEIGTSSAPVFHRSTHPPAVTPNHPPIDQIPPRQMPLPVEWAGAAATSGPGRGVMFDPATRREFISPISLKAAGSGTSGALASGGGYQGADGGTLAGGGDAITASMSGGMTHIPPASRGADPYRMNVKLVMRIGPDFYVCSGTMRDAATVLTAGHCVYDTEVEAWADEIWVYPAWDGASGLVPAPSIANHFGWAHSTLMGSWTNWTVNHDFHYDIGIVALDRPVGLLTGWYGWTTGGSCEFWQAALVSNVSYPAESCGTPGFHSGREMYSWSGKFDSCPSSNRLGLNTVPGCFSAVWGGMSGSGVSYTDPAGNRLVHGITSTSNRYSYAEYQRQFEDWINDNNNAFIPSARGTDFDLQPLKLRGASTVTAGQTINGLTHLAANGSNGSASGAFSYGVYLSSNDQIAVSDPLIGTQNYSLSFGPVSSAVITMPGVTIPANTPPGHYYLGVIYDYTTDGNTANNGTSGWDALPITVFSTAIDLVPSSLSGQAITSPGSSFSVSNAVINTGSIATGGFRVGLYLSNDNLCDITDTPIGHRTIVSLAAGGTNTVDTPVVIPPGVTLGAKFLCAIVDDLNAVGEGNETNNTRSTAIDVLSATPIITLKVNGQHPAPPIISASGVVNLTLDVSPTTYTAGLDWYWAVAINNTLYWVTPTGAALAAMPLVHSAPLVITNAPLLNLTLPPGSTLSSAMFMTNGGSLVSADVITVQVPPSTAVSQR
jgi:hypothetical protein